MSCKLPADKTPVTKSAADEFLDKMRAEDHPASQAPKRLEDVLAPALIRHIEQLKHAVWGVIALLLLILLFKH